MPLFSRPRDIDIYNSKQDRVYDNRLDKHVLDAKSNYKAIDALTNYDPKSRLHRSIDKINLLRKAEGNHFKFESIVTNKNPKDQKK